MVKHTPPFHNNRKGRGTKKGEERGNTTRETQWCSGITCVLAGLRAHYPEHQHKEEEEEEEEENREKKKASNDTSHTPPPFHTPQHTHHNTHPTTHKELTVDSKHHTPFYPTQTITAIPQ